MHPRLQSLALVASLLISTGRAAAQEPPRSPPSDPPSVTKIVAQARSIAGAQWAETAQFFCGRDTARANRADDPEITPTRVFDDLYVIGRTGTAIWAITTRDGIVLIDSGYPDQLESVLLPGMRRLGLDPNDVKYVLLGHGHADHFGGASYFQERGARVALSSEDWDLVENPPPPPANAPPPAGLRPPKRDVVVEDGRPIVLGGLEVTPVLIPGHTPGSLGFVFAVQDGARKHTAALFGGSILLASRISTEGLEQYVRSIEHFASVTQGLGVDVEIQNHPLYDGFPAKLARLATRKPGDEHPFVVGKDAYQRFLSVMSECSEAELERRNAAPARP